jgi:hypothetical protein
LGSPLAAGRNHVIVLDTSSWMAARSGNRTLMDVARIEPGNTCARCRRAIT